MTYRQYTQCVQPENYTSKSVAGVESVAAGLLVAGLTSTIAYIIGTGGFGLIVGGIAGLLAIVTGLLVFAKWWLYGRLICLGGERCAIGMVVTVDLPQNRSGISAFDTDYCFTLLFPPHHIGDDQATIESDGILGDLIKNQDSIKSLGLSSSGMTAQQWENDPPTAVLECECEGAGMYILYQWLKALLGILTVASVASWFCAVPLIGWIACAIAAALGLAALVGILAGIAHALSDAASLSDVNPELGGTLHKNGWDRLGADLLVVKGEWVYDSLHSGWNEIHPVRYCQKIGSWDGVWEFKPSPGQTGWCEAVASASSASTRANQQKPENQWEIHPYIDGCTPNEPPIP